MESDESPDDPLISAIADELLEVARRGVPGTFGVYNKCGKEEHAPLPIRQLRLIVERNARQSWQENRWSTALESTLKRAISRLRGEFGSLQKGQADTRITNEEAALRFFNFDGSPSFPHVKPVDFNDIKYDRIKGQNYNKVLSELVEVAGLHDSPSTITREVKKLRIRLAGILITLDVQPTSLACGQDPAPVDVQDAGVDTGTEGDAVPYIDRPQYHKVFEDLVAQGYKLIAFEGEPGNGKSDSPT